MYISLGIEKPRNGQYLAIENTESFGLLPHRLNQNTRHAPPTWRCEAPCSARGAPVFGAGPLTPPTERPAVGRMGGSVGRPNAQRARADELPGAPDGLVHGISRVQIGG